MLLRQLWKRQQGIKMEQRDDQYLEQGKQGKEEAGESDKTGVQDKGERGQDCHHIPAAFCLQHRDQKVSQIIPENWAHYQIQQRLEVHAGNRC